MIEGILRSLAAWSVPVLGLAVVVAAVWAASGTPWAHYWAGMANGAALVAYARERRPAA